MFNQNQSIQNKKTNERIIFFDSTLRDGEQAPGAAMTLDQKIILAQKLVDMGVDVIEAGFAGSSRTDWQAVYEISKKCSGTTTICSLARCCQSDITKAASALQPAIEKGAGRIHVFVATSDKHMQTKLGKTRAEVLKMVAEGVTYARQFTPDVEFSGEDAFNSDREFLAECVKTAIRCGAKTINLPDTIGEAVHLQYYEFIKDIIQRVNAPKDVVFSVHCHNDKGLATSNSLFGVSAGARQVECCVNGIGERAGNAALEEIAMAIHSSHDVYPYHFRLDTTQIAEVSKAVENITGFIVPNCKACVGKTAFSHGSGVHQDGVLKAWETGVSNIYGAINSRDVGRSEEIVITRHSGVRAITYMLNKENIQINPEQAREILEIAKESCCKIVTGKTLRTFYRQLYEQPVKLAKHSKNKSLIQKQKENTEKTIVD